MSKAKSWKSAKVYVNNAPHEWHVTTGVWGEQSVAVAYTEAHARLLASAPELLDALKGLYEHCTLIHKHWGEGDNTKQANAAIIAGYDAIANAEGRNL
jgi:hypothetical protein